MMIGDDLSLIKEIAVFFHRKILNKTVRTGLIYGA